MTAHGDPPATFASRTQGVATLSVDGRDVAGYVWQPDLPSSSSPRPYLHPVRTLAGIEVTAAIPDSHTHQLGFSVAAPDVDGYNFWGGRSWVAGHGPAWLDNHGSQRHQEWTRQTSAELAHTLHWTDSHQRMLLREQRFITWHQVSDTAWALGIQTRLENAAGRPLTMRSPAALGRTGAGYGGFFWRGPATLGPARILSPNGVDVAAVNGATATWLAITGESGQGLWTLLFVPADDATAQCRWFVRARDYLGVGSCLTWDQPLELAPQQAIAQHIVTVVIDGAISPAAAAELAADVRSAL